MICPTRSRVRSPGRWVMLLAIGWMLLAARPDETVAQTGWVVTGRVLDTQSGASLSNALVTLEGHGALRTSAQGTFRFERVRSFEYDLRVEALGYTDFRGTVEVKSDTLLVAALEPLPLRLDSITVTLGTIDFDGRVRDPLTDSYVFDAEVRSDQGHEESSNLFGRFDLDDVYDGPPLRLMIRGFRYLPLDTTFIPDDKQRYTFDVRPDPVMTRMIGAYIDRLDERAGNRIYEYQAPLNRDSLALFPVNTTLRQVMEATYPLHVVRGIQCFILDEREYRFTSDEERISVFEGTFANQIERLELLEFPGPGRMLMARVYTRWFFQRSIGSPENLRPVSMTQYPGGFFCR